MNRTANNTTLRGFTLEELREAFAYDPETGDLFCKRRNIILKPKGKDYRRVVYKNETVGRIQLYQHRLVWLLHYGTIDESLHIDHINGNRTDNRISNLRLVPQKVNACNTKLRTDNRSGHVGVAYHKSSDKWMVKVGGRYFGVHKRKHQAVAVAQKMREVLNYGPSHGQSVA